MGMYTELVMACELHKEVSDQVITTLHYMIGNIDCLYYVPAHPLFETDRWEHMLRSDSYYFDGDTNSILRYDTISKSYQLTIRCNLKNYCDEIEHFLNWIYPNTYTRGFVGYYRYEESEIPTLIYFDDNKIRLV